MAALKDRNGFRFLSTGLNYVPRRGGGAEKEKELKMVDPGPKLNTMTFIKFFSLLVNNDTNDLSDQSSIFNSFDCTEQ